LPFVPYDLRHAYAIRGSVVFQLPVAVMAELIGHSPELHFSTYNRWISHAQHLQAYEQSANRGDRAPTPRKSWGVLMTWIVHPPTTHF
jgi:hypothetical protein